MQGETRTCAPPHGKLPAHLQADVEVEEADGAPLAQLVLLLRAAHLHDAQRLGLRGEGLHAQRLQAVLREAEGEKRKKKSQQTQARWIVASKEWQQPCGLWKTSSEHSSVTGRGMMLLLSC